MTVRAKFRCNAVTPAADGFRVELHAAAQFRQGATYFVDITEAHP